jgi:hypothetical protein
MSENSDSDSIQSEFLRELNNVSVIFSKENNLPYWQVVSLISFFFTVMLYDQKPSRSRDDTLELATIFINRSLEILYERNK